MSNPLKVLIVCEHASNVFGGEAMLPLNYFKLLSRTEHTPYLITHERSRATIERITNIDQETVFYLPDTWIHKLLHRCRTYLPERVGLIVMGFLMQLVTQFYQWKMAKRVIKEKGIDIVHEPAPVSATQPSAMFLLGLPVIIGPMNGGMSFPRSFNHMSGNFEKLLYTLLPIFSLIYNLIIPGKLFANLMLVANKRTYEALPKFRRGQVKMLVENGAFSVKNEPTRTTKVKALNILYVGRLVDWKRIDIAIAAIAETKTKASLRIVGDGIERERLEAYVAKNNFSNIEFTGLVSHENINQYYDESDIFILSSIRESGGAVILEAMSRGLPTIAVDWGGPADYITNETGCLVEPRSKKYMVSEFSRIIDQLSEDPDLRYKMGMAAINRVNTYFMWDKKVDTMIEYYKSLVTIKQ